MTVERGPSGIGLILGFALSALWLSSCQPDPYCVDCIGPPVADSGGGTDSGAGPDSAVIVDAGCGDAGDFQTDRFNCGECGNVCDVPNAFADCAGGECIVGACQVGWYDLCTDPLDPLCDGCEYGCLVTNAGVEACDGMDNDCDGEIDEDTDLMTDPVNCGNCGVVCFLPNGTSDCVMGGCVLTGCDPGFYDYLNPPPPENAGCEYACAFDPPQTEVCDAFDNNCDGMIDESDPTVGTACGPPNVGECMSGSWVCGSGVLQCTGGMGPILEMCDGLDNDCDGPADEDFDFMNDPATCGGCTPCMLPDATAGCSGGNCYVLVCDSGFSNLDCADPTDPLDPCHANGCETPCVPTGSEVCDNMDNDCNGLIDMSDPGLLIPANFCRTLGECAGITPTCTGATGWQCLYPPTVEIDPMTGQPVTDETLCDGFDNDCDCGGDTNGDGMVCRSGDGGVDEGYPALGVSCTAGVGACAGVDVWVCNVTQDGVTCPAVADPSQSGPEVCNGIDDNCDGMVDNGVLDDFVNVAFNHPVFGTMDFWLYTYEASRPDATAIDTGFDNTRSCSQAGVLPWGLLDWNAADAACVAAGHRLCTEEEWQAACEGMPLNAWPYGSPYVADECNDNLYDFDPSTPAVDDDGVTPTGFFPMCVSDDGAFDMSGNLKEWTDTLIDPFPAFRIRGGAYDSPPDGTRCDFGFAGANFDYYFDNLGFRCCRSTPP